MKALKILFISGALSLLWGSSRGQTITRPSFRKTEIIRVDNIRTDDQVTSLTADQKNVTMEYFDGLGRIIQNIAVSGSSLKSDIIQPVVYDFSGQQSYRYLPYVASGTNGSYQSNALSAQAAFYQNGSSDKVADDSKPYSKREYENSPMQRILREGMPGEGFQPGQHSRSAVYRSNTAADNVRLWRQDGSSPSAYLAGELTLTQTTSEDGNNTYVFTDKNGHTVLQRIQADETVNGISEPYFETYYIYSDAGQLKYTVQPKAVSLMRKSGNWILSADLLEKQVFSYTTDDLGRLVEKKVPGVAPVYIIYDALDRPLLMQDASLRGGNNWHYTKYDDRMRVVMEGTYTDNIHTNRAAMQAYVNTIDFSTVYSEQRQGGTTYGYSNNVFPTSGAEVQICNYYDDYDVNGDGSSDYSYQTQSLPGEATPFYQVRGLLTVVKKKVTDSNTWLTSVNFYDNRGNLIQVQSNNLLNNGLNDSRTIVTDFTGAVIVSKTVKASASGSTTIRSSYSYDHSGRLKAVDDSYNGAANIRVASYEYNELGQVVDKKLHSTNAGGTYLQSVDYRYNIRGNLTSINNSSLTNDEKNDDNNDVFGMEMLYEQAEASMGSGGYYNGMLSAVKWRSRAPQGGQPQERSYRFNYDKLFRLKDALYQERDAGGNWGNSGAWDEKNIRYDENGNILSLDRNAYISGMVTAMDKLSYSYDGNRLDNLTDEGSSSLGYCNLTGSSSSYGYDAAGNLITDPKKGLLQIYNAQGRTAKVTITTATERYITYTYDATGVLLRKQTYDNNTLQKTTDYSGGFVFENGELSFFTMAEGRVRNTGSGLKPEYMIRDYQGNVRVSFEELGGQAVVRQENSYYPYGLMMPGGTLPTQPNRNLYNGGSEWQNDYGNLPDYYQTFWRNYDASTGRFVGVDPYADAYPFQSPYHYAGNNPVMYNDPLGDKKRPIGGTFELFEPYINEGRHYSSGGGGVSGSGRLFPGGAMSFDQFLTDLTGLWNLVPEGGQGSYNQATGQLSVMDGAGKLLDGYPSVGSFLQFPDYILNNMQYAGGAYFMQGAPIVSSYKSNATSGETLTAGIGGDFLANNWKDIAFLANDFTQAYIGANTTLKASAGYRLAQTTVQLPLGLATRTSTRTLSAISKIGGVAAKAAPWVATGAIVANVVSSHQVTAGDVYQTLVTGASIVPGWGLIVGGGALALEGASYYFTDRSVSDNINQQLDGGVIFSWK